MADMSSESNIEKRCKYFQKVCMLQKKSISASFYDSIHNLIIKIYDPARTVIYDHGEWSGKRI